MNPMLRLRTQIQSQWLRAAYSRPYKLRPGSGVDKSERVIEIPWTLSRTRSAARILDVGSADSSYLDRLSWMGREVHALDRRPPNPRTKRTVRIRVGDIRDSGYPSGTFDLILCVSTLEHVGILDAYGETTADPEGDFTALREMARILAIGGRALITVPFGRGLDYSHISGWGFRHYDAERLDAIIAHSGLSRVETSYFAYRNGWDVCRREELANVGYRDNGAKNAAGLACVELVRA